MTAPEQPSSDGQSMLQNSTEIAQTKWRNSSMKLIENAGQWYKMYSQQAALAVMGLSSTLLTVPADFQTKELPLLGGTTVQNLATWCILVAAFLGFTGRLVMQTKVEKPPEDQPK